jgi:hypothetical protein
MLRGCSHIPRTSEHRVAGNVEAALKKNAAPLRPSPHLHYGLSQDKLIQANRETAGFRALI